jgi:hypothetical protein
VCVSDGQWDRRESFGVCLRQSVGQKGKTTGRAHHLTSVTVMSVMLTTVYAGLPRHSHSIRRELQLATGVQQRATRCSKSRAAEQEDISKGWLCSAPGWVFACIDCLPHTRHATQACSQPTDGRCTLTVLSFRGDTAAHSIWSVINYCTSRTIESIFIAQCTVQM